MCGAATLEKEWLSTTYFWCRGVFDDLQTEKRLIHFLWAGSQLFTSVPVSVTLTHPGSALILGNESAGK